MQLFSGEFILLSVLLLIAARFKAKFPITERLLRGLHVYFPPTIDQLKEKPQTAERFSISYIEIDDKFSRKANHFPETDFLIFLTAMCFLTCLISFALKDSAVLSLEMNLSFYLLITVLVVCTYGVYSQMTKSGMLNPDNYMAFMLTLTVFSLSAILLTMDHSTFLDFNFIFSVKMLNKRLTYAVQHFWNSRVDLDYTFFVIGVVGFVSFIMLPYFRFIIRQNLNTAITEGLDKDKAWRKTNLLMSLTPVMLMMLWIKPLTKNNVVPLYMTEAGFEYLRLCIIVGVICCRIGLLRKDVQEFLNQGQGIIYGVVIEPSKESVKHAAFQVKAIASYAWSYAHQGLCSYIVALTFCALLLYKVDLSSPYPKPLKEASELPVLEVDTEEFLVSESFNAQAALIMPSRTKFYYPELRDIEVLIQEAASNRTKETEEKELKSLLLLVGEVNRKGIIPEVFYRDLIQFALWQHSLVWAFGTMFTILYSRKFGKTKQKTG